MKSGKVLKCNFIYFIRIQCKPTSRIYLREMEVNPTGNIGAGIRAVESNTRAPKMSNIIPRWELRSSMISQDFNARAVIVANSISCLPEAR